MDQGWIRVDQGGSRVDQVFASRRGRQKRMGNVGAPHSCVARGGGRTCPFVIIKRGNAVPVARAGLMAQVDFPAARHEGTRAVLVANSGKGETKSLLSRILCSRYWGTGDAMFAFSLSAVQAPSAGATCTCRHWHEGAPARGGRAASLAAAAVPVGLALLQALRHAGNQLLQEARSPILGRLAIGGQHLRRPSAPDLSHRRQTVKFRTIVLFLCESGGEHKLELF